MSIAKQIYMFEGPPGCGKGSLAALCIKHFNWVQLSTGNMCRKHIMEGTQIGKKIDFLIKSGKLIPDDLIVDLVKDELKLALAEQEAVILDGFPRTVMQAELLKKIAEEFNLNLNFIKFNVDEDVILKRLLDRVTCSNKDCQAVYSLSSESGLKPKVDGICDKCSSHLFKREDDRIEVIEKRLQEYNKQACNVISYYENSGLPVFSLYVDKPIEEVFSDFKRIIGKHDNYQK